jgi:hypothetical protein
MMSTEPKVNVLLDRLIELTDKGEIEWRASTGGPYSFEYKGGDGDSVVIDCRDDDGQGPYDLLVFSADGALVTRLDWSNSRSGAVTETDRRLLKLHTLASDQASGTTQVVDRLLNGLPRPEVAP